MMKVAMVSMSKTDSFALSLVFSWVLPTEKLKGNQVKILSFS
jgi:hypothetical protein